MNSISLAGWIILALVVILFVALNYWLFSALRQRRHSGSSSLWDGLKQTGSPWKKEDEGWAELSRRVTALRQGAPPESDAPRRSPAPPALDDDDDD